MKQRYALSPSLEQIEHRLFGVSDGLIEAVAAGEVSERIAQAVKASPEWASYRSRDPSTEPEDVDTEVRPPNPPHYIRDLIQQRVAASQAKFSPSPKAGQVVEVRKIVLPPEAEPLDWVIQAPLYVLLDRPGEASDLWQGWPVSADTDYASSWDFVLQEQDAPFDPEAGMVQVWNPVRLYLPMAGPVVAELRSERLHAVRAMAADFLLSNDPIDNPWPGRISVRETSTGVKVATGSPIGGQTDPRWRYQNMYHYAAEAIRQPANLVLAKAGVFEQDSPQEVNERIAETVKRWIKGLSALPGAIIDIISPKPTSAGGRGSAIATTWGPALAFALVLAIGIAVVVPMREQPVNEAEITRGMGERQLVLATDPEERLKQLTTELGQLGIKYQVERKEGKIILKIQGIDPQKEDVANFLERNHIKPPVSSIVVLEISLPAKP